MTLRRVNPRCENKRRIKKLRALAKDETVDLWAMDEVHFQQYGSRCRMWVPPEIKDPVLQHHPTRKSVGYFGAVRLRDGKFLFAREHDRFNAETTWEFLRLLHSRSLKSRRRVVVITDNAKYHHATFTALGVKNMNRNSALITCRLTVLTSIPIERVWKLTRKLCIHDEYFSSFEAVITVVEAHFAQWTQGNETLRRLCTI
jgi:hypothetical protein